MHFVKIPTVLLLFALFVVILSQPVGFGGHGFGEYGEKSVLGTSDSTNTIQIEQLQEQKEDEVKEEQQSESQQVRYSSRRVNTSSLNQSFQNTAAHLKARNRQNRYSTENSQRQEIGDVDALRKQAANAYRTQRAANLYTQPTPPSYSEELYTVVLVL